MNSDPLPPLTDIRCVLRVGAGRVVLSSWPGLRIAPSGDTWIDPEGATTTLAAFGELGVGHLIALCESAELPQQAVPLLRHWSRQRALRLVHAPIRDYQPPNARFLRLWRDLGPALHAQLGAGAAVALACSYGAGRSGTLAAFMLYEHGLSMPDAVRDVRKGFHAAIESAVQERWLLEQVLSEKPGLIRTPSDQVSSCRFGHQWKPA